MASIGAIRNAAFSTSIHMRAGSARLGANANIGARRGFAGHGHDVSDVRRNYSLVISTTLISFIVTTAVTVYLVTQTHQRCDPLYIVCRPTKLSFRLSHQPGLVYCMFLSVDGSHCTGLICTPSRLRPRCVNAAFFTGGIVLGENTVLLRL